MKQSERYEAFCNKFNKDSRVLINFLIRKGLIKPLGKCPLCRRERVLSRSTNFKENLASRCPKCRKFPLFTCSFFEKTRLPLRKILDILFCWANQFTQTRTARLTKINRKSINQFYRYARDVASWKLLNDKEKFQFGGPHSIVQIDESLIAKRKYHRGRIVKQKWVLGIYDTKQKRGLVIHVKKRDAQTLLPIIARYVVPGSEIWTDEWKAYGPLTEMGYIHKTVNHSKNFKDPVTGVCTNAVEGFWAVLKKWLRSMHTQKSRHISEHIDEFMWRRTYIKNTVNELDVLLDHIAERYPL